MPQNYVYLFFTLVQNLRADINISFFKSPGTYKCTNFSDYIKARFLKKYFSEETQGSQ
jgi:hypothetical protein